MQEHSPPSMEHSVPSVTTANLDDGHAGCCPAEVAKAMLAVQRAVGKLAHDSENPHHKFNYTSVDGYYEAVRPAMNEAGLAIVCSQESSEMQGDILKMTLCWTVIHESGKTWPSAIRKIVYVRHTGPQSIGAAISYGEKFMLRSLFKLPTGEEDADAHPAHNDAVRGAAQEARPAQTWQLYSAKGDAVKSCTTLQSYVGGLLTAVDRANFAEIYAQNLPTLKRAEEAVAAIADPVARSALEADCSRIHHIGEGGDSPTQDDSGQDGQERTL